MDDADFAQARMAAEQAQLERHLAAARGVIPVARSHCEDCGDALPAHRVTYGRCVTCQEIRERRVALFSDRMGGAAMVEGWDE